MHISICIHQPGPHCLVSAGYNFEVKSIQNCNNFVLLILHLNFLSKKQNCSIYTAGQRSLSFSYPIYPLGAVQRFFSRVLCSVCYSYTSCFSYAPCAAGRLWQPPHQFKCAPGADETEQDYHRADAWLSCSLLKFLVWNDFPGTVMITEKTPLCMSESFNNLCNKQPNNSHPPGLL